MSDNKKYYYLKLKEDFFDNEEMKVLESMKNGVEYQNVYLKMCLLSLKSDGALLFKNMLPYSIEMLSSVLRLNIDTVKTAIEIFSKIGLITITDTETIYMTDIQTLVGQSSTEAERVKKYRQNLAQKKQEQLEAASETECTNVVQMYENCTGNVQNCTPEYRDKSIEIRDKNLNISSEKSEDIKKGSSVKSSKENKYLAYINSVSEQIKADSNNLVQFFYNARKVLDEKFERNKLQLLGWQVDFAMFLLETNRSYDEVINTMKWTFNDSYWNFCSTKPSLFIKHYDELFLRSKQTSSEDLVVQRWLIS